MFKFCRANFSLQIDISIDEMKKFVSPVQRTFFEYGFCVAGQRSRRIFFGEVVGHD